jgi:predicted nucleic acid-binding protein
MPPLAMIQPLPPSIQPTLTDDYLLSLAASQRAILVSGDAHVLALAAQLPIRTPAEFLALVEATG